MLDVKTRKLYMEKLGYSYDKKGILKLQTNYFFNKKDKDGIYGKNTDILLQNVYNVKTLCKNFDVKSDRLNCRCNGKYCTGHPHLLDTNLLRTLQNFRTAVGFSMIVESALRCEKWNKKVGGSTGSKHTKGKAIDIYNKTYTNSLERRKVLSNKWVNNYPSSYMSYSNGYMNKNGKITFPKVSSMGISLHLEVK